MADRTVINAKRKYASFVWIKLRISIIKMLQNFANAFPNAAKFFHAEQPEFAQDTKEYL